MAGALMLTLPLAAGTWWRRRTGVPWSAFGLGVVAFAVSQVVHLPLNAGVAWAVARGWLPRPPPAWDPVIVPLALGLSAGLCEEVTRYVALRTSRWRTSGSIGMVGIGHGGFESMLIGLLVLVQLIGLMGLRDEPPAGLAPVVEAFFGAPPGLVVLGVVERALAMTFHLGAAFIVGTAVVRGWSGWLGLAIGLHAGLDAGAVALVGRSPALAEVFVAVAAFATLALGLALARTWPAAEPPRTPPAPTTGADPSASSRRAGGGGGGPVGGGGDGGGIVIRAEGLTRRFGDRVAVDHLDLEVRAGEVLGFLGPNGAGKTTTIRMLCALVAPTEGAATVLGHDVRTGGDTIRRDVGLLTETPGLYERLSVRRNLEIFGALYGVADLDARVRRWLERTGLWDRRDSPAGSLSKGMRQKLALCRAVLHEPRLVFLDEPTSALDPEAAGMVREVVRELKDQGRTVFLTTHNLEEADRLCDRIAVFATRLRVLDTAAQLRRTLFGHQVSLRLAGPVDPYLAVVERVGGVSAVTVDADAILATVEDPRAVTPSLVRAVVEAGGGVLGVGEVHQSLERVYLALVAGEGRP